MFQQLYCAEYRKVTEKPSYELKELNQVSIVAYLDVLEDQHSLPHHQYATHWCYSILLYQLPFHKFVW